jgi:glycine hydroxymethyltransferase
LREQVSERTGFLFDGSLDDIDPATARITAFEEARQVAKLIMIASESAAPRAVREALATVFTDLYAEGYPAARMARESEDLLADVPYQTAYHERYSDRRYYKGTEFADIVEALAQDRVRALFAPNRYPSNKSSIGPDQIQANVQPLSGANANTAVYFGLLLAGDTIMGLNLAHGGHLSHGSPVNISGKLFKVVSYGVDPATGRIDYDEAERLALEHNPRMIVAGASAYPWFIDFARLRRICDALPRKAYLLADVSHPSGLVVAGLFPNPVGIADVTTFTTHKTLIGPRAAVILTTNETLARRIDRAVFPGLQGGPHINTIAALAVAFKIAQTAAFNELQSTIVQNAVALAEALAGRGLTLGYGGTESHLLMIDLRTVKTTSGVPLNGDVAARILDLAGIVCNKNTIAGDLSATFPGGIRLGTPWISQRGLTPSDMPTLGKVIADVIQNIQTFWYFDRDDSAARGKIRVAVLKSSQVAIGDLIARRTVGPPNPPDWPDKYVPRPIGLDGKLLIELSGRRVSEFLEQSTTAAIRSLASGEAVNADFLDGEGNTVATATILHVAPDQFGLERYAIAVESARYSDLEWWLRALSSGLVLFDEADPSAKVDGPVSVRALTVPLLDPEAEIVRRVATSPPAIDFTKPYFIGQRVVGARAPVASDRPICTAPPRGPVSLTSPVGKLSLSTDETAPNGWTMPRTYGDSVAELKTLREGAGLIDETALGITEVAGPDARLFLDLVATNDLSFLGIGRAQYTFLLDPDGRVVADAMLYRMGSERFWLTTSPEWTRRVTDWLKDAASGTYAVDRELPSRTLPSRITLRDVRNANGDDARMVIGIAGPSALAALRQVADTPDDRRTLGRIRRFNVAPIRLAGGTVEVARTGHTGGTNGYEIFIAPDRALAIWNALMSKGADLGVRPVGWDAWRACGIAAGLPMTGHEISGEVDLTPVQVGFGPEVQVRKPFFVGRRRLLDRPYPPFAEIVRFRFEAADQPMPNDGAAILDESGSGVGAVTSLSPLSSEPIGLGLVQRSASAVETRLGIVLAGDSGNIAKIEVLPRFPK